MVTCELSHVWCWLRRSQHNKQHMQFTRRKKSLSRAEKTALGAFRKRSVRVVWNEDLLREKGGNINVKVKLQLTYRQDIQHSTDTAWRHPSPLPPHWAVPPPRKDKGWGRTKGGGGRWLFCQSQCSAAVAKPKEQHDKFIC